MHLQHIYIYICLTCRCLSVSTSGVTWQEAAQQAAVQFPSNHWVGSVGKIYGWNHCAPVNIRKTLVKPVYLLENIYIYKQEDTARIVQLLWSDGKRIQELSMIFNGKKQHDISCRCSLKSIGWTVLGQQKQWPFQMDCDFSYCINVYIYIYIMCIYI